ncbi:MAG: tetratricopeptide repeat protein [Spirochaetales bacterium]|jgi:tetratricopeptide (TPR) repeat protein|nr:tetratricopeptide repeat protein [Spirochaetales bacterium]
MKTVKSGRPSFLLAVFVSLTPLLACSPKVKPEAGGLYLAAVEAYVGKNYSEALLLAGQALNRNPGFIQAAFLRGKALFFSDRLGEAQKEFERLASRRPQYTEARIWNIRCLILLGSYDEARRLLEAEIAFNSEDWQTYYLYALLSEKTDDYEQRLYMNRRAEAALTAAAKVFLDQALIFSVLGLPGRTAEYLEKAKTLAGDNASLAEMEEAFYSFINTQEEKL